MKRTSLLLVALLSVAIGLTACGTQNSVQTPEEYDSAAQASLVDGRLTFPDFDAFAIYWGSLINQDEAFLNSLEQRMGYTSERHTIEQQNLSMEEDFAQLSAEERESLADQDLLPRTIIHDPYLQSILNEKGLVQIADIVYLVTDDNIVAIPVDSLSQVDLSAVATPESLGTQANRDLGVAYSPIERSTAAVDSTSVLESQGLVSFIKDYLIPKAELAADSCVDTYYKKRLRARRVVGASGAAKFTWIKLPGNPSVYGLFAGTGNVGRLYTPNKGDLSLSVRKNVTVSGTVVKEVGSRTGTYTSSRYGSALPRIPYWVAGLNIEVSGSESTTHTASDRGRTGTCNTSDSFNFQ